jgi:hypothetical protein
MSHMELNLKRKHLQNLKEVQVIKLNLIQIYLALNVKPLDI